MNRRDGVKDFITPARKRKIRVLWAMLEPVRRTRVFQLPPTKFFVFNPWEKLTNDQKEMVFDSVNNIIACAVVKDGIAQFVGELKKIAERNW